VVVQTRDQREQLLLQVDHATGATTVLLSEQDDAWINLKQSMPKWLTDGTAFLWMSESDGEWRLALHETSGRRIRVLNPDDSFRLRDVVHLDESRGVVTVTGSDAATEQHLYELSLGGGDARRLTASAGIHSRVYGRGDESYAQRFSSLVALSEWELHRTDGALVGVLPSNAEAPPFIPRVELTRVGPSGEFDAVLVRPTNFVPGVKYPVIVYVYGGPSGGVVRASMRSYFLRQWYADQGFIVVSSDNRGVANRGRAWERAIRGSFGEIPLNDQIVALQALGAAYPEMDLKRVGIMGWSFGGYMSALAVSKRGDVFHAAAAGAPVIDWSYYDTHYTERYLGLPQENADGYAASSVLTHAAGLKRPLLLIHGTADDNVYFGNSLRLVDRLLRMGKSVEFVPLAGYTHMVPDAEMRFQVESRIAAFFRRHLIQKPPAS
ncbi:MAG: prolyl oligopeptidase family serine peptidase, partial [Phycisphaerae bacterium]